MKTFRLLLFLTLFPVNPAYSQDSVTAPTWQNRDHAQNRLFWMSTGRISTPEKFSIGNFEVLTVQAGYVPTDFLQVNASVAAGLYWSVGAKAQLFASDESILQGLSVGTDFGFYPQYGRDFEELFKTRLFAFNIAGSFGTRSEQLHINILGMTDRGQFVPMVQIGGSIDADRTGSPRGLKFMAEGFVNASKSSKLEFFAGILGVRSYGEIFVGELAVMYFPSIAIDLIGHAQERSFIFPYLSLAWYF